ncbi:patatin-like phospholipase family protein [Robertkochia sediminum]|uniref:patatin-like phospholipase family protein n=1 Tax=Robertkochia sediminum TaxID=2785326 RepID=UPI0019314DB9|nr:patatin-like phospholipase family protein [Robertkochia sediminum]MBL7471925.1 patatin-like phospholipase family protein [Robertkochia sediminum]
MRSWIILFILFVSPYLLFSQSESRDSIKVGLVLSGGGAKGLAHIGALRAIEEAGVRIDFIGGTSMGAIVGALYASGYSAQALDSIFRNTDIQSLIQGEIPRGSMSFYEKKKDERYALSLPFDDFKVSVPSSITSGQRVYNEFSRLLFHVSDVEDFNDLPIPFFCMATDVETGDMVKLDNGYLPLCISASGAFPSLFEPVRIGDRTLIDGGVVNNYPIEEVRAMGANVIIGVDVQDALKTKEELRSATQVLLQINNYRTVRGMVNKRDSTDIYIKPDITDYSVISFDEASDIIDQGYLAGERKRNALDSLSALQAPKKKQEAFPEIKNDFVLNSVEISGNQQYSRRYIKGKLRYEINEVTSFDELEQGFSNLEATENFSSIKYVLRPAAKEGRYDMELQLQEDATKSFLRLGIHYDGLYNTGGLVNLTRKHFLLYDDVVSLDFVVGDQVRYNFNYYLDKGSYWSLGVRSRFNTFEKDVDFEFVTRETGVDLPEVNKLDIKLADLTNQIYVQTNWGEEFVFGLGLEHKWLRIRSETVAARQGQSVDLDNSNYLSGYGFLKLDTLDDLYFPTRGVFFDADFHLYMVVTGLEFEDTNSFSIAKAKGGFALPITHNWALNLSTEGGFSLGSADVNSLDFVLGGYGAAFINNLTEFVGYDFLSFGGDSYVKATFKTDWNFTGSHHLNFTANIANAGNGIFENGEWWTLPDYIGYAAGYGFESLVGPAEIMYNWSPEGSNGFWMFSIGYRF